MSYWLFLKNNAKVKKELKRNKNDNNKSGITTFIKYLIGHFHTSNLKTPKDNAKEMLMAQGVSGRPSAFVHVVLRES